MPPLWSGRLTNSILITKQTNFIESLRARDGVKPINTHKIFCSVWIIGIKVIFVCVLKHVTSMLLTFLCTYYEIIERHHSIRDSSNTHITNLRNLYPDSVTRRKQL